MATEGVDVTDPACPLYPDVHTRPVNNVIECILYNHDLFTIKPGNHQNIFSECEISTSAESTRIAAAQTSLISELRALLSKGKYAIVRGWYPDSPTTWNKESIAAFKGNLNQDVQYQGKPPQCSSSNPFP